MLYSTHTARLVRDAEAMRINRELSNCVDALIYLVDPASSHMLVSKTKPCMSQYTSSDDETANGSLNQLWFLGSCHLHG